VRRPVPAGLLFQLSIAAGVAVQHFFVGAITTLDESAPAARSSGYSWGGYQLERIRPAGVMTWRGDLKPAE